MVPTGKALVSISDSSACLWKEHAHGVWRKKVCMSVCVKGNQEYTQREKSDVIANTKSTGLLKKIGVFNYSMKK